MVVVCHLLLHHYSCRYHSFIIIIHLSLSYYLCQVNAVNGGDTVFSDVCLCV